MAYKICPTLHSSIKVVEMTFELCKCLMLKGGNTVPWFVVRFDICSKDAMSHLHLLSVSVIPFSKLSIQWNNFLHNQQPFLEFSNPLLIPKRGSLLDQVPILSFLNRKHTYVLKIKAYLENEKFIRKYNGESTNAIFFSF